MSNILIIGATSSVAMAVAQRFAKQNHKIFCFAKNEEKMRSLIEKLGDAFVGSVCFDFLDEKKVLQAVEIAIDTLVHIDIILIAHGNLYNQTQSENDFEIAKLSFQTNCLSTISFLIPLSNQLINQKKGKIGVISSVAGDRGRPRNYTYGAAKGAISLYLEGLRSRLWKTGIEIYDFKMGPVDSPMTIDHEKNFSFSSIETVSKIIHKAFQKKSYQIYVPSYWSWVMLLVRNMPESIFQKLKFLSGK